MPRKKTFSRYDFMQEGESFDPIINSSYPDPLTLNYFNLKVNHIVKHESMTSDGIVFFWKVTENVYGQPIYDDIVLTLNKNKHKNLLKEGQIIGFPAQTDIEESFKYKKI